MLAGPTVRAYELLIRCRGGCLPGLITGVRIALVSDGRSEEGVARAGGILAKGHYKDFFYLRSRERERRAPARLERAKWYDLLSSGSTPAIDLGQ